MQAISFPKGIQIMKCSPVGDRLSLKSHTASWTSPRSAKSQIISILLLSTTAHVAPPVLRSSRSAGNKKCLANGWDWVFFLFSGLPDGRASPSEQFLKTRSISYPCISPIISMMEKMSPFPNSHWDSKDSPRLNSCVEGWQRWGFRIRRWKSDFAFKNGSVLLWRILCWKWKNRSSSCSHHRSHNAAMILPDSMTPLKIRTLSPRMSKPEK